MAIRLIVGLGNPGAKYAKTRHNAGAWFLSELAEKYRLNFRAESKFSGHLASLALDGQACFLLIPSTFMNESGRSAQAMLNFYKILPQEMLIAHDELDFPAGVVRLKFSGGHGGHNGLRDIIERVGHDFYRLRIGIDHPGHKDKVLPYVLGEPSLQDKEKIMQAIQTSLNIIPELLAGDMDRAFRELH